MDSPDLRYVVEEFQSSVAVKQRILEDSAFTEQVLHMGQLLIERYRGGNKLLIGGNGGSAADAQHIAAEFVSRFNFDRPGLPALALTTDTSILTAVGNDYGYDQLFRRQLEANGVAGDVFLGISTSGNSPNILQALEAAAEKGVTTFGMTGESGGAMRELCDYCLCVPSAETPRIQEVHILIGHTLCAMVELALFADLQPQ
ncbi:D-sedoheptulose 7-phosphate isomerase [Candidatus Marimicrobium litorale]|jgi:D-sedoheptulose 7-phosphate isomerase|uniref:Phosphoheptose isomerase n=1 Tax=Candidatus Marimicrobium litorale TaxID=2518991 RepID=A0ABT3T106_9GAMM|nr:D-sedoheptulose 7-phosphate isomerase [Candidatus Marimicrobium litorale]MCX2975933.1 D-sedoheptulose 7-phosphate isomerase [Candidatus Marimicrobium litorale]